MIGTLGNRPLIGVMDEDPDLVRLLLSFGADPNVRSNDHNAPILTEAADFGYQRTASLLISSGADLHATDDRGETALSTVRLDNRLDMARLLRRAGATH